MNRKIEYENYLEKVQGLFPMPRIMAEVSRILKDDEASLDDLGELLLTDATLVSEVMLMSNSSYFGFSEKSESLSEAMQRIGMREIARLVGICMAGQVYQAELLHYRIPPEVFWESGIAAALLMERLADELGIDSEAAYLAGLMRESGMLVINHALSHEGRTEVWESREPLHIWEREVAGCDHMAVGARMLNVWGFSDTVANAVASQWGETAPSNGLPGLLNLVNRLLARTGCNFCIQISDYIEFESAFESLGLGEDRVRSAIESSSDAFQRLSDAVLGN